MAVSDMYDQEQYNHHNLHSKCQHMKECQDMACHPSIERGSSVVLEEMPSMGD